MSSTFREDLSTLLEDFDGKIPDTELISFSDSISEHRLDIPRLFRYMPANYYSIRDIEKKTLFLSEVGCMNDFFEGVTGVIEKPTLDHFSGFSDMVYLKSFSESQDNLLMWGHYADNYKGICVEYDLQNMNDHSDYYYHLFPVVYRSNRFGSNALFKFLIKDLYNYKIDNQLSDAEFLQDITSMFLVKSKCWEYEQEWRIIVPYVYLHNEWSDGGVLNDDDNPNLYSINHQSIDFPYIRAVYMGPQIVAEKRSHIIEICKRLGIKVYDSNLSSSSYCLDYTEVE